MVAGMITVLMFYIMMFINNSAGLEKMRGAFYITTIMSFGVIVVGVFSYIYIFYTNSFISKRRKNGNLQYSRDGKAAYCESACH